MTDRRFYITTAISYPNGKPHIGHAYEAIATDMIARWKRLDGFDVHFLTGVDVHGLKMFKTARDAGVTARALAERNTPLFQDLVQALDCSNDDFISTLEPRHYRASEAIWRRMEAAGDIYKAQYAGWYSVRDEAYYDEGETTLRPDGVRLGPQGTPVEWTSEETFFFRLSSYGDRLLQHYAANPDFIAPPERRNEVTSFVEMGLSDLSISRSTFDWGIPVPGQPGHVMYVWVDALTNYITGVGFPDEGEPDWAFWPADLHVIGKDILRFHAVYWPAFLMSAGIEPPKKVFAHGFLLNRGEKMSKSVGNVVDPHDLIARFGTDAVRYFFLRDVSFGQDGSWSEEAIAARNNADLANDLGNLAQRTLTMVARQCGGVVPKPGAFSAADAALLASLDALADGCREEMDRLALNACLARLWASVGDANRYVAAAEPWKLAKSDPERMRTVLFVALEALRRFAILVSPAMPAAAAKLLGLLGQSEEELSLARLPERLQTGAPLPAPAPLFPRIELSGEA